MAQIKISAIVAIIVELLSSSVRNFERKGDGNLFWNDKDVYITTDTAESVSTTLSENRNCLEFPTTIQQKLTTDSVDNNDEPIVTLDENENDSSVVDSDSGAEQVINRNDFNEYSRSDGIVLVNKNDEPPCMNQGRETKCWHNHPTKLV